MADTKDFLGRGFRFPPKVDSATGRFMMESGEDDIRSSIYIIIMTKKGERAMMPDFGCNVMDYVFELPDTTYLNLMRNEVIDAITSWEPRVVDVSAEIHLEELDKGKVVFEIEYTVRATNNPNNLVFPYYLYEGVGIEG